MKLQFHPGMDMSQAMSETVSCVFDQSPYVTRAIAGLTMEGALGAVLSGLMVLLFLRDWLKCCGWTRPWNWSRRRTIRPRLN